MKKTNENVGVVTHTHTHGITLIALVITIVVLIILSTVAINLSIGNSGIFNKAKYAKSEYVNKSAQEHEMLLNLEENLDIYTRNSNDGKIDYYDLSIVGTTYNPYNIKGYVTYNATTKILEINIYHTAVALSSAISNHSKILNLGFINNLSTSNLKNTNSYVTTEKVDFMSGNGATYGGTWTIAFLSLGESKNIYVNNTTGSNISYLGAFCCKIWLN